MERRNITNGGQSYRESTISVIFVLLALVLLWPAEVWAKAINAGQAGKAVRGWLEVSAKPLGTALGKQIARVDTFADDAGEPAYYIVYLEPSGFVVVPADDLVEPIIAFVARGSYDPSDDNPLGALVRGDVPARVASARWLRSGTQALNSKSQKALQKAGAAQGKWAEMQAYADGVGALGVSSISDVRVAPLTQSTWGQRNVGGYTDPTSISCYNYYTGPYGPGDNRNYPCGCVATAMSQLIRYHEYPSSGPSGSYVWSNMPLEPTWHITVAER